VFTLTTENLRVLVYGGTWRDMGLFSTIMALEVLPAVHVLLP